MKALIFDFDGLIIDTESADYLSWQAVYAAYGVPFPLDLWLGEVGTVGVFDPVDYLAERASRPLDPAGVRAQFRQQDAATVAGLPIMPGVLDWLAQARQQGLALAIASSSPHEWVDGHLQRLGLYDRFDVIVCRDDVSGRAKPNPDVYQLALGKLGVAAQQALALEDSRNGVLAARAAGLRVVAVPNPVTQYQDLSPATWQLSSLAALSLPALLAEIARPGNHPAASNAAQVREFHQVMGGFSPVQPVLPPAEVLRLRAALLAEEYTEVQASSARLLVLAEAGGVGMDPAGVLAGYVHELADLLYVTYGAMLACGVDPDPVFAEVHRANMAKQNGPLRDDGKQLKPAGWQPADVAGVIRQQAEKRFG